MDIYRFFHPHHNPRLHTRRLRQQELGELEQVASELRKALERAEKRTFRAPSGRVLGEHYADIIKAMRFVENSLQTLCDAHPEDTIDDLKELISEREGSVGWERWTELVREQLIVSNGVISDSRDETQDAQTAK